MAGARPLNRTILTVDIEAYSGAHRTNPDRVRLRRRLARWCRILLLHASVVPDQWAQTDTGDGLIISIDPHVPRDELLSNVLNELPPILRRHNQRRPSAGERVRLRLAVHAGDVVSDPEPLVGEAVNHVCRLLDADELRACLRATDQPLAVVASQTVYDGIIKHAYLDLDPSTWHRVRAETKEGAVPGWVHVPGDTGAPRRAGVVAAPEDRPAEVPRELPPDLREFTGRTDELGRLDELLESAANGATTAAIDGLSGVGKSALAIHAAHRHADRFRDGQLYLDLQGNTVGLAPMPPLQALGELLISLGVDPRQVPTDAGQAARRFRSLTAGRRLLIVLDNARDADQVQPLLPSGKHCAVLVTSRGMLAFAAGVTRLSLNVLSEAEAVDLLGRLAGHARIQAEPDAARRVVHACGLLPLALQISGQRLATRPSWTVGEYADRLTGTRDRLSELEFGRRLQIRRSFQVSYEILGEEDPRAARALRLLSLMDGPDFAQPVVETLLEEPGGRVVAILDRLVDANLLQALPAGRYRFHDLLREFAREHAREEEDPEARTAAVTRALRNYAVTARHTFALLRPGHPRFANEPASQPGDPDPDGLRFADANEALEWLEAERANLTAGVEQAAVDDGLPSHLAAHLASPMLAFFLVRSHHNDWLQVNQTVLRVADQTDDRAARARALYDLSRMYRRVGSYPQAEECIKESLALYRGLGDRQAQAACLSNLGVFYQRRGWYKQASKCYRDSLRISRSLREPHNRAETLNRFAVVHQRQGRYDEALKAAAESVRIYHELGAKHSRADVLSNVAGIHHRQGRYDEAASEISECLAIYRELGDRHGEAHALLQLGGLLQRLGRYDEALQHLHDSRAIYAEVNQQHGCAVTVSAIGALYGERGFHEEAVDRQRESLRVFRELEDPHYEAVALSRLGTVCQHVGRLDDARPLMETCLAIRERLDDRHGRANALSALGSVHRQRGEHDLARTRLLHSIVAFRQLGDPFGQAVALRRLGRLYRDQGHLDTARSRWRYALRLLEQLESPVEASEVRHLLIHGSSRHKRL